MNILNEEIKIFQKIRGKGMMIGGVTIFGLPSNLPIYLDDKIFRLDYLIVGSGNRSTKIKINPEELRKIPNTIVISNLSY